MSKWGDIDSSGQVFLVAAVAVLAVCILGVTFDAGASHQRRVLENNAKESRLEKALEWVESQQHPESGLIHDDRPGTTNRKHRK